MVLTPGNPRDYALIPAIGVAAVSTLTVFLGVKLVEPPIYLASWFELLVGVVTFGVVASAFYRWRIWRREIDPSAYSVRDARAWALEEDWRHQLGLWGVGLLVGALVLAILRFAYGQGWLRFAWPT